jgi:Gas vesicle protein
MATLSLHQHPPQGPVVARHRRRSKHTENDWLFPQVVTQGDAAESSLLDVIDNVLNHGVVLYGDLILGVANVDLIYAKVSLLVAALDKLPSPEPPRRK